MKKEYIVFSMKLAGELMCNGFPVKRMEKSKILPKKSGNIRYWIIEKIDLGQ